MCTTRSEQDVDAQGTTGTVTSDLVSAVTVPVLARSTGPPSGAVIRMLNEAGSFR
jgi:hypothetical protein